MKKESLQITYFIVVSVCSLSYQKRNRNKKDEKCVSCNLILKNFVLKINSYAHTQMYIYTYKWDASLHLIHQHIYNTGQNVSLSAHIDVLCACVCICVWNEWNLSFVLLYHEWEGQNTKERKRNEMNISEENNLC
jgi:hypothetical protein